MDIDFFKKKLNALAVELASAEKSGSEAAKTVTLDQSRVGRLSRMDAMQTQAMAKEAKRRRRILLQRIESALKRIEEDDYGWCTKCEDEIDIQRLKFDPTALLCINCAAKY